MTLFTFPVVVGQGTRLFPGQSRRSERALTPPFGRRTLTRLD
jgi:hypothetical protein